MIDKVIGFVCFAAITLVALSLVCVLWIDGADGDERWMRGWIAIFGVQAGGSLSLAVYYLMKLF